MINKCPHCDSEEGYYTKTIVSRTDFFNFSNVPEGAGYNFIRGGNIAYCLNCNRVIGKFEEIQE
jgi:hypothetical protein